MKRKNSAREWRMAAVLSLAFINGTFIFFGVAIITLGSFAAMDHGNSSEILGNSVYISGVYILIFLGLVTIIISSVGFIAASRKNTCLLITYIMILGFIALLLLIAVIMVFAFSESLKSGAKTVMTNTLKNQYGRYRIITDTWNWTQGVLGCCGVEDAGWSVYDGSWWDRFTNTDIYMQQNNIPKSSPYYKFVPVSCCETLVDGLTGWPTSIYYDLQQCQNWQYGPPNHVSGPHNDALVYRGCFGAILDYLKMYANAIGAVGFILCLIVVAGIISAVSLLLSIRRSTPRKYNQDLY